MHQLVFSFCLLICSSHCFWNWTLPTLSVMILLTYTLSFYMWLTQIYLVGIPLRYSMQCELPSTLQRHSVWLSMHLTTVHSPIMRLSIWPLWEEPKVSHLSLEYGEQECKMNNSTTHLTVVFLLGFKDLAPNSKTVAAILEVLFFLWFHSSEAGWYNWQLWG